MSHKASQQVLDSVLRGDSVNVYIHSFTVSVTKNWPRGT